MQLSLLLTPSRALAPPKVALARQPACSRASLSRPSWRVSAALHLLLTFLLTVLWVVLQHPSPLTNSMFAARESEESLRRGKLGSELCYFEMARASMTDEKRLACDEYLGPCLVRKTFVTEGTQCNVGPSGMPVAASRGGHLTLETQILSNTTILVYI